MVIPALRHAVAEHYGIALHDIKLLLPNRSFKTTSGKIQRQATKKAYLQQTSDCIDYSPKPVDKIKKTSTLTEDLRHLLSTVLGITKIELNQRFSELGGTSMHPLLLKKKLKNIWALKFQYHKLLLLITQHWKSWWYL